MSLEATWLNQGIWELKRNQLAKQALMFSSNLTKNSCIDSSQLYKSGTLLRNAPWQKAQTRQHIVHSYQYHHKHPDRLSWPPGRVARPQIWCNEAFSLPGVRCLPRHLLLLFCIQPVHSRVTVVSAPRSPRSVPEAQPGQLVIWVTPGLLTVPVQLKQSFLAAETTNRLVNILQKPLTWRSSDCLKFFDRVTHWVGGLNN